MHTCANAVTHCGIDLNFPVEQSIQTSGTDVAVCSTVIRCRSRCETARHKQALGQSMGLELKEPTATKT
jgi:hypothetical protein